MRKNIFKLILAVLLIGALAVPAFAVDCDTTYRACDVVPDAGGGGAGISGLQFSPNVVMAYAKDTAGTGSKYIIGSFNTKGTKSYAVDSDFAGIFQTKADVTAGQTLPTDQSADWASATWSEVAK